MLAGVGKLHPVCGEKVLIPVSACRIKARPVRRSRWITDSGKAEYFKFSCKSTELAAVTGVLADGS